MSFLSTLKSMPLFRSKLFTFFTKANRCEEKYTDVDIENTGAVQTSAKKLAENLSKLKLNVYKPDSNEIDKTHRLYYLLRCKPNNYQNSQQFWQAVEYRRNTEGFCMVRINRLNSGLVHSLDLITDSTATDLKVVNGNLYLTIISNVDSTKPEIVNANDLLIFSGVSNNGVIGNHPSVALDYPVTINERINAHQEAHFRNRGLNDLTFQSGEVKAHNVEKMNELMKEFMKSFGGSGNLDKPSNLPYGVTADNKVHTFRDSQMNEIQKEKKNEVYSYYNIPSFMVGSERTIQNVEAQSLAFSLFSIQPIAAIYQAELEAKLLTRNEVVEGYTIRFDLEGLIEADIKTKTDAIKTQVTNGLLEPDDGARKLGNVVKPSKYGQKRFMQAQYVPLDEYDKFNPLLKDDPHLKQVKSNDQPRKEDT